MLKEKIIRRIRDEGPISFETFMDMALYEPGLGYYAKDSTEIGRGADFYTSSHLHRAFGAMLGRQAEEMWELTGRPARFDIVEMGAGMGYLAKDLLDYVQYRPPGKSLVYTIVELNPSVTRKQQDILGERGGKVRWIRGLESLEPVTGCLPSPSISSSATATLVKSS
jgi:SAM-dependent MidA family methyltransferase